MTLSIREKKAELDKTISIIENYLRDYANKPECVYTLDDMLEDITNTFDVHIKKRDILESIEAMPELELTCKQLMKNGKRKRFVVFLRNGKINEC